MGVCHSRKTFCLEIHTCPLGKVAGRPLGMLNLSSLPPLLSKGKQTHPFGVKHIYIYISPSWKNKTHLLRYRYRPQGQDPPTWRPTGPAEPRAWKRARVVMETPPPTPPGSRVMNRDLPPTSPAHKSFLFRDGSERNSPPFPNAPQCQGVAWTWSPTRDTETPFYRCAQLRLRG